MDEIITEALSLTAEMGYDKNGHLRIPVPIRECPGAHSAPHETPDDQRPRVHRFGRPL